MWHLLFQGVPENRDPGPQCDPSVTLEKKENRDTIPYWSPPKTGKIGPKVTIEKLYNCKSTFICVLTLKATELTKQNLKHFNFEIKTVIEISLNLTSF